MEGGEEGEGHDPAAARAAVLSKAEQVKASEKYEELVTTTDKALLDSAEEHFRMGNHQAAIYAYDAYLDRHPEDVVAWNNRGVVFDAMGDNAAAVKSYGKAVELQPSYEVAWCNRGNSLTYMGNREDAAKNYIQSIRVNRKYRAGYDYLVQLLRLDADLRDVLKRVQALEQEIGESTFFKYHTGMLLDEMGKHRRAVRLFTRALELDDGDPEIWKAKGNAHFSLERGGVEQSRFHVLHRGLHVGGHRLLQAGRPHQPGIPARVVQPWLHLPPDGPAGGRYRGLPDGHRDRRRGRDPPQQPGQRRVQPGQLPGIHPMVRKGGDHQPQVRHRMEQHRQRPQPQRA
jgi:tetratricopeptide (TPR) repeat protein